MHVSLPFDLSQTLNCYLLFLQFQSSKRRVSHKKSYAIRSRSSSWQCLCSVEVLDMSSATWLMNPWVPGTLRMLLAPQQCHSPKAFISNYPKMWCGRQRTGKKSLISPFKTWALVRSVIKERNISDMLLRYRICI